MTCTACDEARRVMLRIYDRMAATARASAGVIRRNRRRTERRNVVRPVRDVDKPWWRQP